MPPAVPPFPRLLLSLCLTAASLEAFAVGDSVPLKVSPALSPAAAKGKKVDGPSYVDADRLLGMNDDYFEAEGKVVMRNLRERVEADWMRYDQSTDEAQARGHVVLIQEKDRVEGTELRLKLTDRLGNMKNAIYAVHGKDGGLMRGKAKVIEFQGPDRYQMEEATYSTCPLEKQDWVLKMDTLNLDYNTNLGSARQVRVEYLDVPILYTPWLDFSLDSKRKSGFLSPTYGATANADWN